MDLRKAKLERRLRSAVADGDGRKLLEAMADDPGTVGRLLYEMGAAAGPAIADAVRTARTDDEMRTAIGWAGTSGEPTALDEVRRVVQQGSLPARLVAISTLLTHGTPEDARMVAECLSDPDERVAAAVFDELSEFARIGGTESLPAAVTAALSAELDRRAERMPAVGSDEPFTRVSAAKILVALCSEIDDTYSEPLTPGADERRASLRRDIATVGSALYDQGGEDFMREVAMLVASSSSHGEFLSREWTGIGGWMG